MGHTNDPSVSPLQRTAWISILVRTTLPSDLRNFSSNMFPFGMYSYDSFLESDKKLERSFIFRPFFLSERHFFEYSIDALTSHEYIHDAQPFTEMGKNIHEHCYVPLARGDFGIIQPNAKKIPLHLVG
jgi:hypothetical protein